MGLLSKRVNMGEYKNASNSIIWIWSIQRRLLGDASRYSRSNRMQTMRQRDQKFSREAIKDPPANNSALNGLITKNKEDDRRLKNRKQNSEGVDRIISRAMFSRSARRLVKEERPDNKTKRKLPRVNT